MAICRQCGERFLMVDGECPICGWEVKYRCYACGEYFYPKETKQCEVCRWFTCPDCNACNCTRHFIDEMDESFKKRREKLKKLRERERRIEVRNPFFVRGGFK